MDDIFSDVEWAMAALGEPLGNYAPRCRRLVADYKDSAGKDLHQDLVTWHDRRATDEALVQSIREALAGNYCRCISHYTVLEALDKLAGVTSDQYEIVKEAQEER